MEIVVRPILTEKVNKATEKLNKYGFIVNKSANKIEVRNAVEKIYNVTVVDVNTIRYSGKPKSRYTKTGVLSGSANDYKKAIVTLAQGDSIDFYSNI